MLFKNLTLESLTYVAAPHTVTSEELEDRLHEPIGRLKLPMRPIQFLTGIAERTFWAEGTRVAEVAANAARQSIAEAGIDPSRIGLLINASVSKDFVEPSTASIIHGILGLGPHCRHFDLSNACLGFLDAMDVGGQMIESGAVDYALIVAGESARGVVDTTIRTLSRGDVTHQEFWNNFATLTLGSGAVAAVLGHASKTRTNHRINGCVTMADTANNHLCRGTHEGMITDSLKLLKAGVSLARSTWGVARERLPSWDQQKIGHFVMHQVGKPHMDAICGALELPTEKCFRSYPKYGNVGPAAVPLTLALARDAQALKEGDNIGLMGIGSGLNVSMMSMTW